MSSVNLTTTTTPKGRSSTYNLASPRVTFTSKSITAQLFAPPASKQLKQTEAEKALPASSRSAGAPLSPSVSATTTTSSMSADSSSASRTPLEAIRTAFNALSDATAPTPRSKANRKASAANDEDEEFLIEYYGLTNPPTLHYNAPPPSYDDLYGPGSNQSTSRVDVLKGLARKVGKELVGGH